MKNCWHGKRALVCGASQGLGLHIAEELLRQKANVLLVGRDAVKLQAACDALRAAHGGCDLDYIACDLCSEESVVLLSQRLFEQPGSLDLIVQAVGESDRGELQKLEVSRLESLFQKNVVSGLLTIKHLTPLLAPKGELAAGGVLVFIGSLSSHFAPRFLGGYSIVKHGVAALAQQARLELAPQGIHVLLASPGPIARNDSGKRYQHLAHASDLPAEALKGGGGAKLKGLDPVQLSRDILTAALARKTEIMRPSKARLLVIVRAIWPRLGDWILRSKTS